MVTMIIFGILTIVSIVAAHKTVDEKYTYEEHVGCCLVIIIFFLLFFVLDGGTFERMSRAR